jgi:hypothetical protein
MARLAVCSLELKIDLPKLFKPKTKSAAKPRLRYNLDVQLIKSRKDLLKQLGKK